MIIDARSLGSGTKLAADICVVGAGIAGLTFAREFQDRDITVCLVESGGLEADRVTQSLYWGENVGFPYYPLDTARARFFGGSSNCWNIPLGENVLGVRLRPLDPIDFEVREWVPYSGWPFGFNHLQPFYERAQTVCRVGPFSYGVEEWEDPAERPRLPFAEGPVKTAIFQFSRRDLFFRDYRNEIAASNNITGLINANATGMETNASAGNVTRLHVACLNGRKISVSAGTFVLALGAIETPRLMLLSNGVNKGGLGNGNDLVGRFFMEHPHLWSGIYVPSSERVFSSAGLYGIHTVRGVPIMGKLTLSEEALRRERILNYVVSIHPKMRAAPSIDGGKRRFLSPPSGPSPDSGERERSGQGQGGFGSDLGRIVTTLRNRIGESKKLKVFELNHMSEQLPNPESRVTLSEELDALGQRRSRLNWRMTELDIRTIVRGQEIIDQEMRRAGLGRIYLEMRDATPPSHLTGGWHHMGTTRMSADPKLGVVDKNCRVHGISNLYVAGPSVFPTGGYANPVLTIVALAIRLADRIKERLA